MSSEVRLSLSSRWSIVGAVVVALIAIQLGRNALTPSGIDFISYWAAARLLLAGTPALAYDIAVHHALELQAAPVNGLMSFPYPPPFLMVVAPFGLLPFPVAAIAWTAFSLGVLALAVRRAAPGTVGMALAFPPVLVCGIIGQNGLLSAALMIAALSLLDRRPFIAGLLFGVLALKPQLAAAVPVLLLASRNWRAIGGAVCSGIALCLISLVVFGLEPWRGFLAILPFYGEIATHGGVGWNRLASVYAALRAMGVAAVPAGIAHAAFALPALWLLWRTGRDASLAQARGAALVTATMLLSPYVYMYDQVLLVVAVIWALQHGYGERGAMYLYLVSLAAYLGLLTGVLNLNLIPALPLALLFLLYRYRGFAAPALSRELVPAAGIDTRANSAN